MKKQTLIQATHLALIGKSRALQSAAHALLGKPAGGWAETRQALLELRDELPMRHSRSYTVNHFVDAVYTLDASDRYIQRSHDEAIRVAAQIEKSSAT
jgi:hypothetical protein